MKTLVTVVLLSLVAGGSASAETLKGEYGACVGKDLFAQFVSAAVKKDEQAFE